MGGVLTVTRLLCGPRASLPEEDGGAPEGVLIGAPAAPCVEREEEDEAPSNPPTGGDVSNEDPPPYVRKNTLTLIHTIVVLSQNTNRCVYKGQDVTHG